VAVFAAYVLFGRLGLLLGAVRGFATLVWAPTGIALAALLLGGRRLLPGVALGAFAVNVWTGATPLVATVLGVGNTLEAVVGAHILRKLGRYRDTFDRLRHVLVLVSLVALLSPVVSATIGVTALTLGRVVPVSDYGHTWRTWWTGDALGDLVVAPLVLSWARASAPKVDALRATEALLVSTLVVSVSLAVFFGPARTMPVEASYALFPLFIWAAIRFDLRGATAATAVASALAIAGTARGFGPFARETLSDSLLALQAFMGSASLTPLVVAAAMADRAHAIRTRDSFLAIVSHDLKNPLSAMQASADLLTRYGAVEALPGHVERHGALVHRSVERMTRLLGDLLDAAAIDAGHLSMKATDESLGGIVDDAVEILTPLAQAKHQTLCTELAPPLSVRCDRQRVLQILSNLVGNAVKFTSEGGAVTLGGSSHGDEVHVFVRDTGVGIGAADLPHVFERFWHGAPESGGGTGLGLFIASGIVEAHGGRIWADSKRGAGTTVFFSLPLSPNGHRGQRAARDER
jgi:signal transduction histidine kinase